jgi:hypothetical protein
MERLQGRRRVRAVKSPGHGCLRLWPDEIWTLFIYSHPHKKFLIPNFSSSFTLK